MSSKNTQKRFAPKLRLKTGDTVVVIAGRDKGQTGRILRMFPDTNKALVEGVQLVTKHVKPQPNNAGEIIEKEAAIQLSNLMYSEKGVPTRVGRKLVDGKLVRYSKKSGQILD
jgi:large subunit ribosomal protein L24